MDDPFAMLDTVIHQAIDIYTKAPLDSSAALPFPASGAVKVDMSASAPPAPQLPPAPQQQPPPQSETTAPPPHSHRTWQNSWSVCANAFENCLPDNFLKYVTHTEEFIAHLGSLMIPSDLRHWQDFADTYPYPMVDAVREISTMLNAAAAAQECQPHLSAQYLTLLEKLKVEVGIIKISLTNMVNLALCAIFAAKPSAYSAKPSAYSAKPSAHSAKPSAYSATNPSDSSVHASTALILDTSSIFQSVFEQFFVNLQHHCELAPRIIGSYP
jgi:hypothetical protein